MIHQPDLLALQSLPTSQSVTQLIEALSEQRLRASHLDDYRQVRNLEARMALAERRLALCQERDAIQATRPDGCWCLGAGGNHRSSIPDTDVVVYLETCNCAEGLAEAGRLETELPIAHTQAVLLRRAGIWGRSGIPLRFQECRTATWPSGYKHNHVLRQLMAVGRSIFLHGPFGTGKTGLAVGYAWDCLQAQDDIHTIRFIEAPQMFAEMRDSYSHPSHPETPTEEEIIRRYAGCSLLILDDLGAEQVRNTGWLEDRLYQVVGTRHQEQRQTIITSNLNLDQLADRIGERVTWRLHELIGESGIVDLTSCPNLREA